MYKVHIKHFCGLKKKTFALQLWTTLCWSIRYNRYEINPSLWLECGKYLSGYAYTVDGLGNKKLKLNDDRTRVSSGFGFRCPVTAPVRPSRCRNEALAVHRLLVNSPNCRSPTLPARRCQSWMVNPQTRQSVPEYFVKFIYGIKNCAEKKGFLYVYDSAP